MLEVSSEAHRQELLNGVLGSVKRCQVRFGGRKSELATEENEAAVRELCRGLERVFQHGVVSPPPGSSSSAFVVGDIIPKLSPSGSAPPSYAAASFWHFLKRHLGKSDLDRFLLLSNVNTDLGRCRAWLRAAVNEHTLERYVHAILTDVERDKFYESFAFLNDVERSSMLAPMSAGIGSIHFAIRIDVPGLNKIAMEEGNEDSDLIAKTSTAPRASEEEPATATSQTKKKRRVPSQFVSFDGDDVTSRPISPSSSSSSTRPPRNHQTLEKQILLNQTSNKTISSRARARASAPSEETSSTNAEQRRSATPTRLSFDRVELAGEGAAQAGSRKQRTTGESEDDEDGIDIYSKSPTGSRKSALSLDEGGFSHGPSAAGSSTSGARLTPMKNVSVGQLIPLFSSNSVSGDASDLTCDINSEDSVSIRSFGEESDYATFGRQVSTSEPPRGEKGQKAEISRPELKQALLSVMARKEELQRQLAQMKKLLEQETRNAASLKEEVAESRRRSREESERQEGRVGTLGRENELLKHQLKKYVGAVQKLRDGPQAYETLAQLDKVEERQERERNYVDYHYEASEYEKKLIHLAEMHGELIEFNEHLRRASIAKDGVIAKMKAELEELRGPLPIDEERDQVDNAGDNADVVSLASSSGIGVPSATRALIHLWIPSVFLSGNGSKTHHVYQVYLRIRDEEWNIYRRYSDFYALHNDLRKKESLVDSFYFPPKKSVGYKTEKVVEERRKRLQSYLRQVVNLLVQTNPALAARPNKENVLLLMPFFAENYVIAKVAAETAGRDRARSQSRGRSIFSRRKTSTATATTAGAVGQRPQLAL